MPSLESLQTAVARSVLGRPVFGLAALFGEAAHNPYGRLRVYQNNTRASLTATLIAVFPVTVQLVDERFFRYAASEFVRAAPPREPRLVRYGADFPAYLRTFPGLEDKPFVAETARLEWAIAEALDAPSRPAVPLAALQAVEPDISPEFVLQPSLRMLVSHWPVLSIWAAHQQGARPDGTVFERGPERVALWRAGDDVRFERLSGSAFSFRHGLKAGRGLEKAVVRALAHDPMFDLTAALVALFGEGLVTHVRGARPTSP